MNQVQTLLLSFFMSVVFLGSLIQKEGRLLIVRFFSTPPRMLLRPPRLLILAKGVKSPILFICLKHKGSIHLVLYVCWWLFEKIPLHCIHVLRRWFGKILLYCICILRLVFISGQI